MTWSYNDLIDKMIELIDVTGTEGMQKKRWREWFNTTKYGRLSQKTFNLGKHEQCHDK